LSLLLELRDTNNSEYNICTVADIVAELSLMDDTRDLTHVTHVLVSCLDALEARSAFEIEPVCVVNGNLNRIYELLFYDTEQTVLKAYQNWCSRYAIIRALALVARKGDPSVIATLCRVMKDPVSCVRAASLQVLSNISPETDDAVCQLVLASLSDRDWHVRQRAVRIVLEPAGKLSGYQLSGLVSQMHWWNISQVGGVVLNQFCLACPGRVLSCNQCLHGIQLQMSSAREYH